MDREAWHAAVHDWATERNWTEYIFCWGGGALKSGRNGKASNRGRLLECCEIINHILLLSGLHSFINIWVKQLFFHVLLAQFTCCIGFVSFFPYFGLSFLFLSFSLRHPLGLLLLLKYLFIFFLSLLLVGRVFSYHCLLFFKSIFCIFLFSSSWSVVIHFHSLCFYLRASSRGAFSLLPFIIFLYIVTIYFLFLQLTVLFDCLSFCDFFHIGYFPLFFP